MSYVFSAPEALFIIPEKTFLVKIIEEHSKLSFETNYIDLRWFWGVLGARNGSKMDPNQAKFTQNWTFLATYTPDMVIIWPHMACLPIFLSHTTYTSHIPPHMGSNGRQIAVNRGFSWKKCAFVTTSKNHYEAIFWPRTMSNTPKMTTLYITTTSIIQICKNLKSFCWKLQISRELSLKINEKRVISPLIWNF